MIDPNAKRVEDLDNIARLRKAGKVLRSVPDSTHHDVYKAKLFKALSLIDEVLKADTGEDSGDLHYLGGSKPLHPRLPDFSTTQTVMKPLPVLGSKVLSSALAAFSASQKRFGGKERIISMAHKGGIAIAGKVKINIAAGSKTPVSFFSMGQSRKAGGLTVS